MVSYAGLRTKKIECGKHWKEISKDVCVSNEVIAKINKDEYISLRVLEKFGNYWSCDIGDLVQIKKEGI